MILEVAILDVRAGQEAAFETALRAARPLIAPTDVDKDGRSVLRK